MTRNQKFIVALPFVYSCFLSLIIFVQVNALSSELTSEAKDLLVQTPARLLISTFLLLLPNLLLSFFLLAYARAHPNGGKDTLILCLSSLVVATVLSCAIWVFYYIAFSRIPVLVFGFPVIYFFGMAIGYVVGLVGLGLQRKGDK